MMAQHKKIALIGYRSGHGAKKQGTANGPDCLQHLHLEAAFNHDMVDVTWLPPRLSTLEKSDQNIDKETLVHSYCHMLHEQVLNSLKNGYFPITIGGDHSMAIGSWSAMHKYLAPKPFGLIWFDAHLDAHTKKSSHSKAFHGMPLSYLLGKSEGKLDHITGNIPCIDPKHLCLIGIRSYEKEEHALLKSLGVSIFYMDDIKKHGLETIFNKALHIANTNDRPFGISLDIDAIDPADAPGTGSHAKGGICYDELQHILTNIGNHPHLCGLEIAEFNPELDKNNQTAQLITNLLQSMFTT